MVILREYHNGSYRLFYNLDRTGVDMKVKECTCISKAYELQQIFRQHFPFSFSDRSKIDIYLSYLLRKQRYEQLKNVDS